MVPDDGLSREAKRDTRRKAMLAAAHDLFVEKGFEATTLSDVVRRSGGSLATLYEMFENKPGLLRALVSERCAVISDTIDRAILAHQPPREALTEIAGRMFDTILNPDSTALLKAALAQPDLGPQLYQAGPATGQAKIAEYLAIQAEEGVMTIDDPIEAAQMFFQIMFGHFHQRMMFGVPVELGEAQKKRHFERTLAAFFKIYGNERSHALLPAQPSGGDTT
ncbi:MAG TPA: TetR/AcrR family transcriptional regulator [Allosphingosinicella sp.]|jgi:AcrR family transcriptional regulator